MLNTHSAPSPGPRSGTGLAGQRVLIADDEVELQSAFCRMLEHESFQTERATSGEEALARLEEGGIDLALLDVCMPGMSGIDVLSAMRERGIDVPSIVISGAGSIDQAVQATRLGAFDFVQKPIRRERLVVTIRNALKYSSLQEANEQLRADLTAHTQLVGDGPAMTRLKKLVAKVAPSDGRVLICGENGTGKELVAAALHAGSARSERPFVKLNCGAVPKDLVESELFGHEKGAFTGALSARKGRFELADGGTLMLDEIGDMPMPMQVKLLRVLQEGVFERVGGSRTLDVDVRVIAATNRDLEAMVAEGSFREDLYYRLNVLTLRVPPLRERKEDIPALVQHFTRPGTKAAGLDLDASAIAALQRHDYPGNVRELQNLIERLAILHRGETVSGEQMEELPGRARGRREGRRGGLYEPGRSLRDLLRDYERQILVEAIAAHGNSKSAAAEALGTERSHFYKKCRQYQIE
ncbi:MAG: sigma-54 dependent transcriptional regulator [Myxococcales bacterium]|nr:sigma-54 dependent transcriptional regulator [Myxococcales bacterium]